MFSVEEVHKLISLFQSETVLWCVSSPDYHKTPIRDAAWKRIGEAMGEEYTGDVVKRKLETLRSQYVRELHTYQAKKRSGSGTDEVPLPKWRFFSQMDVFMRAVVTPKPTVSNYAPSSTAEGNEDGETESQELSSTVTEVSSNPCSSSKRQRKSKPLNVMEVAIETLKSVQQRRQNDPDEETDTDVMFGKIVACKLKEVVNETEKIKVKGEIEMLLLKAKSVPRENPAAAPASAPPPFRPYNL